MVWRINGSTLPEIRAYGECIFRDLLPTFENLNARAEQIANAEYARLCSQPADDNWDGDVALLAERAQDKGLVFYETMYGLRQSVLNLLAVGLFHRLEQELADLCRDGAFIVDRLTDSGIAAVTAWYALHFELELNTLPSWPTIGELRLLANATKHAEGPSAERLRDMRPELFENPYFRDLSPGMGSTRFRIHRPLSGEDLYVTPEILQQYCTACVNFISEITEYFEQHAEDWFPRP